MVTCPQRSTLERSKIRSSESFQLKNVDTVAGDDGIIGYSDWMPLTRAVGTLFMLQNLTGAGGILAGFSVEVADGFFVDANGVRVEVVLTNGVFTRNDEDKTPLTPEELELMNACSIKERLEQCCSDGLVDVDSSLFPPQLTGDTGAAGNNYILELNEHEFGRFAENCEEPCFVRVCVETTAPESFVLLCVLCGLQVSHPPLTRESVA